MEKYFTIDIGGTDTKYGVLDQEANILLRGVIKTRKDDGLDAFLDSIKELYEEHGYGTQGIAISMPGIIDEQKGYCYTGGYLMCNYEQPIAKLLADKCKTNVHIDNDGKCAALAEYWKGTLKGCSNGLVLVLGSGIGGGVIIDGKLMRGKHLFAGELSFLNMDTVNWRKEDTIFGLRYGAIPMIEKIRTTKRIEDPDFNGIKAFELINNKDAQAFEVLQEFAEGIASQLFNLQIILDMEVVAIGGGISRQPILIETIKNSWDRIIQEAPYRKYSEYMPQAEVKACKFTSDANLIGALYSYLNFYNKLNAE